MPISDGSERHMEMLRARLDELLHWNQGRPPPPASSAAREVESLVEEMRRLEEQKRVQMAERRPPRFPPGMVVPIPPGPYPPPGPPPGMRPGFRGLVEAGMAAAMDQPPPTINTRLLAKLERAEPRKVCQRVPDRLEVITAWRAWAVKFYVQYRLTALGKKHVWEPRKRVDAFCDDGRHHPAPDFNCQCGVWAFKTLDNLVNAIGSSYQGTRVLGQVSLWGRVLETENGYRAQYAYPSELWLLDNSLEELGYIYDVPVRTI